jgi:hypothetical protein
MRMPITASLRSLLKIRAAKFDALTKQRATGAHSRALAPRRR